jgi:hypothetical protein
MQNIAFAIENQKEYWADCVLAISKENMYYSKLIYYLKETGVDFGNR